VRKLTTALTAGGMALVVFVFAAVLMLDAGLRSTLVSTGSADNVVVIRQGSQTEVQSGVFRDQASLIETSPEVARGADGQALVSKEVVVLNSLPKRDEPSKRSNVVVRGLPEVGKQLRRKSALSKVGCSGQARRKSSLARRWRGNLPASSSGSSCRSRAVSGRSSVSSMQARLRSTPRSGATSSR
jgi:hypothetical protein